MGAAAATAAADTGGENERFKPHAPGARDARTRHGDTRQERETDLVPWPADRLPANADKGKQTPPQPRACEPSPPDAGTHTVPQGQAGRTIRTNGCAPAPDAGPARDLLVTFELESVGEGSEGEQDRDKRQVSDCSSAQGRSLPSRHHHRWVKRQRG